MKRQVASTHRNICAARLGVSPLLTEWSVICDQNSDKLTTGARQKLVDVGSSESAGEENSRKRPNGLTTPGARPDAQLLALLPHPSLTRCVLYRVLAARVSLPSPVTCWPQLAGRRRLRSLVHAPRVGAAAACRCPLAVMLSTRLPCPAIQLFTRSPRVCHPLRTSCFPSASHLMQSTSWPPMRCALQRL